MSGIAGIFCLDDRPVESERLERMAEATPYRGPDGIGVWKSGGVGLLNFQTVTTPEALGEVQPLRDESRGLTLTWDGRLDNRQDLRRELPESRRPAVDAPDSSYFLAAFLAWDEDCLNKLVGDFVFALWQRRERKLFCARSLTGFRTFVWWSDRRTFLFGSEPRSLFAGADIPRRPNEGFVAEILAAAPTSIFDTLWEGVSRLPRGKAMTVDSQGVRRIWHWHQGPFPEIRYRDDRDYEEHFRHLLEQAVEASLRSIGPVAADLSGGLDSSAVVCLGTELYRTGRAKHAIIPFSRVYPGEPQDESEWIDLVTAHTGVESVRSTLPPYDWDFWRAWSAESLDLPIKPNSAGRRMVLPEMQAHGCRVCLCGEGGDDWFAGSTLHWLDLLRAGRFSKVWREAHLSESTPLSLYRTARRFVGSGLLPLVSRTHRSKLLNGGRTGIIPAWISLHWAHNVHLSERLVFSHEEPYLSSFAQRRLYMPNIFLPYFPIGLLQRLYDQHGIDRRAPLHDKRLIEFALGVPGGQLRAFGQRKWLFRRAVAGSLPEPIRLRQTKAEFSQPIRAAIESLGPQPALDQLIARGWIKKGKLLSQNTPLTALWSAVAVETWLNQAVHE